MVKRDLKFILLLLLVLLWIAVPWIFFALYKPGVLDNRLVVRLLTPFVYVSSIPQLVIGWITNSPGLDPNAALLNSAFNFFVGSSLLIWYRRSSRAEEKTEQY